MLYLDHAATTPIDEAIRAGMLERFETRFANPSSAHGLGRQARKELEHARHRIAELIGAESGQIVFTGGGTESLGLAVLGSAGDAPARIAISSVEHSAISESAYWLKERLGWQLDEMPVDELGVLRPQTVAQMVTSQTRIVAVMMVNNEVGAINDLASIAQIVRRQAPRAKIIVDAVQAFAKLPLDVGALDVDLMAFTSHKIHGPKGIGGLWARNVSALRPVFLGGGQEAGLRGGTQCAVLAWGFGEASDLQSQAPKHELGRRCFELLKSAVPDLELIGPDFGALRAPHICSVHVPGIPTGPLLNSLSEAGVCCSAGSACTRSSRQDFSKVLLAMQRSPEEGAFLRFSVGRTTVEAELAQAATIFGQCVAELRAVYAT